MIPAEVGELLRWLLGAYPSAEIADETPVVWAAVLEDVPAAEVFAAARRWVARGNRWLPSAGELREAAAITAGLLAPDLDAAWQAAQVGDLTHPAVAAAARATGDPWVWRVTALTVLAGQFRHNYETASARFNNGALTPGAFGTMPALEVAPVRAQLAPPEPDPLPERHTPDFAAQRRIIKGDIDA